MTGQPPGRRGARNRPVNVYWEPRANRLINLLITLADDPRPRSTSWIREHIDGYDGSVDTVRKQIDRDRKILTELGFRIAETTGTADSAQPEKLYSLNRATSYLPAVHFTPGQWDAVTAAGRWATDPSLEDAVRAAVVKLTPAAPARQRHGAAPVVGVIPDTNGLKDADIRILRRSIDRGLQLRFHYWSNLTAEPEIRVLEPWGVAAVDGRLFLTGFDPDRDAQRTFRLARIADLEPLARFRKHPVPDRPLRVLVAEGLAASSLTVTARVLFRTSGALELREWADGPAVPHEEGEILTVGPVDRTWFLRTAAAYAPDAVVLDPPDLVAEVVSRLKRARTITAAAGGES